MTASDIESANVLNNLLKSVFVQKTADNVPNFEAVGFTRLGEKMDVIEVTVDEVCKKVEGLSANKSPGADDTNPRFLKKMAKTIALPLIILFR